MLQLSWEMKRVKVLVVGAGVVGLSTAVCVAETLPYCSVTVIAEKFSPDTTGDGAAGILLPKEFPGERMHHTWIWYHVFGIMPFLLFRTPICLHEWSNWLSLSSLTRHPSWTAKALVQGVIRSSSGHCRFPSSLRCWRVLELRVKPWWQQQQQKAKRWYTEVFSSLIISTLLHF